MTNKIICISRQAGTGGRTIGEGVAAKLGVKCYHAEIIDKIAEETGYVKDFVRELGENSMYQNYFMNSLNIASNYGLDLPEDIVWKAQQDVIRNLAKEGPCVIVGRCADYILQNNPNVVSVYIYAPLEDRVNRIVTKYGLDEADPVKYVKAKDKRRIMFYEYHTDCKFGDPANYDLCLNSSKVDFDSCIDIITNLCK